MSYLKVNVCLGGRIVSKKPGFQFNIIKNDELDGHKGAMIIDDVAPVYIELTEQKPFVDMGGLHGRAKPEKAVKWFTDMDKVLEEDGERKDYILIWMALDKDDRGVYYSGVTSCYFMTNKVGRRRLGYKMMHEHVNSLDHAMKGRYRLEELDDKTKSSLIKFLKERDQVAWENSTELHEYLNV